MYHDRRRRPLAIATSAAGSAARTRSASRCLGNRLGEAVDRLMISADRPGIDPVTSAAIRRTGSGRAVREDGMKVLALVDAPTTSAAATGSGVRAGPGRARGGRSTSEALARGLARPPRPARRGAAVRRRDPPAQAPAGLAAPRPPPARAAARLRLRRRGPLPRLVRPAGPALPAAGRAGSPRTVRLADAVVAGNDFLADCALRAGARPERVRVIPTCVDDRPLPAARPSRRARPGRSTWSGSARRARCRGSEQQRPLWERLGREVPGVRLRVICDRFPDFDPMPVVAVPWSEATEAGRRWRPATSA